MVKIVANNGSSEDYVIELKSPTENVVTADEPIEKGGQDKGFSPKELLASALAACTNATVRVYCKQKGWVMKNIHVEVELLEEEGKTTFKRTVKFEGDISDEQRTRLTNVANACPIHKILTHTIAVDTTII